MKISHDRKYRKKERDKATTNENDFVLDPASGGYSVFQACKNCSRNFIGCDIEFGLI